MKIYECTSVLREIEWSDIFLQVIVADFSTNNINIYVQIISLSGKSSKFVFMLLFEKPPE